MYTTKIAIRNHLSYTYPNGEIADSGELLGNLLSAMYQNGQISEPNHIYFPENDFLCTFVCLMDIHALDKSSFNSYGIDDLSRIKDENIIFTILGQNTDYPPTISLSDSKELILFTKCGSYLSPIRDLNTFNPIALYTLPKTNNDKESHYNVVHWQSAYQSLDSLNMWGINELFALEQLGNKDSEINQMGLEICQKLMTALNKPVYYYLHRYYSDDFDNDENICCPSCGGKWLLDERLHGIFDFKCDKCHLLSNLAYYPIDER